MSNGIDLTDVGEDRVIDGEDYLVETRYIPAERWFATTDGVLHVVGDDGPTDAEMRFTRPMLETMLAALDGH